MQTDELERRLQSKKYYESIAFRIYKVLDKDGLSKRKIQKGKKFENHQLEAVGSVKTYISTRQVCRRFNLPAGDYVVIPACFDPDVDMGFLLRVFVEGEVKAATLEITKLNKKRMQGGIVISESANDGKKVRLT